MCYPEIQAQNFRIDMAWRYEDFAEVTFRLLIAFTSLSPPLCLWRWWQALCAGATTEANGPQKGRCFRYSFCITNFALLFARLVFVYGSGILPASSLKPYLILRIQPGVAYSHSGNWDVRDKFPGHQRLVFFGFLTIFEDSIGVFPRKCHNSRLWLSPAPIYFVPPLYNWTQNCFQPPIRSLLHRVTASMRAQ